MLFIQFYKYLFKTVSMRTQLTKCTFLAQTKLVNPLLTHPVSTNQIFVLLA